jgi:diguanylate cyclase (GGDEF)-like protein
MSIDNILAIETQEKLWGEMDTDALRFTKRVIRKSLEQDISASCKQFIEILYKEMGLSFGGVYINGDLDVSAEIDVRTGDAIYGRVTDLDLSLLCHGSNAVHMLPDSTRLVVPIVYRGNSYGTAVFDKRFFSEMEAAILIDCCMGLSKHVDNVAEIPRLRKEAFTDDLTGMYNRRKWRLDYLGFQRNWEKLGQHFSVIFADIDYFKKINDTYGHVYGDQVLQKVSELIRANLRPMDRAYRYGGEEFGILLPGASESDAELVAGRISDAIRSHRFDGKKKRGSSKLKYCGRRDHRKVSLSMGVCSSSEGNGRSDLLREADERMLTVKSCCRDAVLSSSRVDIQTGVAGMPSFLENLGNNILQCNRPLEKEGITGKVAVLIFDMLKFGDLRDSVGAAAAQALFSDYAKWLYSENHSFNYVARVYNRDDMVVSLSCDPPGTDFERHVTDTAMRYLGIMREKEWYAAGKGMKLDFAGGCCIYSPEKAKNPAAIAKNPNLLFGFAENLVEDAVLLPDRFKLDFYSD